METTETFALIGATGVLAIIIFAIYLLKKFSEKVNIFLRDTMKEKQADGYWKWSKGSIIIVVSFGAVIFTYIYHTIMQGWDFQAFLVMVGMTAGLPISGAYAKKINPLTTIVNTPTDEPKN